MRQMFLNALAIFASACVMLFAPIRHASAYTEAVLHSSCHAAGCIDGRIPHGLLRDSSGNLFGTTHYGGKYKKGVVFKLVTNADGTKYTDHIIHNFCAKANCADGSQPWGDLVMDVDGNLYGTTAFGGASSSGVIWQLSPTGSGWKYTIWHSFCHRNCPDGSVPTAGLSYRGQSTGALWDKKSPLFGTTTQGGLGPNNGNGVLYELGTDPVLIYIVVRKFKSSAGPQPVTVDTAGNLFGTTDFGGQYGAGLLYKFAPQGDGTWKETVLHEFCADECEEGTGPVGKLLVDGADNIFGVTEFGGNNCGGDATCGVVFEKPADSSYSVIYTFCSLADCTDGASPFAGLIRDASGNLFGTTAFGGDSVSQKGIVFELTQTGVETVLYRFCPGARSCVDGANPYNPVILDSQNNLFGNTAYGGEHDDGTVFELKP